MAGFELSAPVIEPAGLRLSPKEVQILLADEKLFRVERARQGRRRRRGEDGVRLVGEEGEGALRRSEDEVGARGLDRVEAPVSTSAKE